MKRILIILFIIITLPTWATHYYIFETGSDSNPGTSIGSAWATVGKVSSEALAGTFNPGDTISFQAGGKFNMSELRLIGVNGSSGSPIVINSVGDNFRARIFGLKEMGTFTQNGNIWTITDSDLPDIANYTYGSDHHIQFGLTTIDSVYYFPGMTPDDGTYNMSTTGGGTQSVADNTQSWTVNQFANASVQVRTVLWGIEAEPIQSNTSTLLVLNSLDEFEAGIGSGHPYRIANDYPDKDGEYQNTTGNLTVYWSIDNLNTHTVEAAVIDTIVYIVNSSYIEIRDINFSYALTLPLYIEGSNNITIDNCILAYSGGKAAYIENSSYFDIINNYVYGTNKAGIDTRDCGNGLIGYNDFKFTSIWDLTNIDNNHYNDAVSVTHAYDTMRVIWNKADTIGSFGYSHYNYDRQSGLSPSPVYWEHNIMDHYGWTITSDNAGIYFGGDWDSQTPKYCRYNIFLNSGFFPDYREGGGYNNYFHAMYGDYSTSNIAYDCNFIYKTNGALKCNNGTNREFRNNVGYDLTKNMSDFGANFWSAALDKYDFDGLNVSPKYDDVTGNKMVFGQNASEMMINMRDITWWSDFTVNNNAYQDPFNSSNTNVFRQITGYGVTTSYNISQMCSNLSWDCSSTFDYVNWHYSDVSGLISEEEMVIPGYNATDQNWYMQLGNCVVKDCFTGINYSDSVLIPPGTGTTAPGRLFFYVSGNRSTITQYTNAVMPVTYWEAAYDTIYSVTPPADTCDERIYYSDTSYVNRFNHFGFENTLTGSDPARITWLNSGTIGYSGSFACENTYAASNDQGTYNGYLYSDLSINTGDTFALHLCWADYYGGNGTLLSNTSGISSGWFLKKRTGGYLDFVTYNSGGSSLTASSNASVIGTGTSYDIRVDVNKTAGTATITVDGVDETASSSIRTDFSTDGILSVFADNSGSGVSLGWCDSLTFDYSEQSIVTVDSCVQYGAYQEVNIFLNDVQQKALLNGIEQSLFKR